MRMHSLLLVLLLSGAALAQLDVPPQLTAGDGLTVHSKDEVLLFGPGAALKRQPKDGKVEFSAEEVASTGTYTVISGDEKKKVKVVPGAAKKVSFIARPSRVPVARPDVITGVAFVFDNQQNLVLTPTPVKFDLMVAAAGSSRTVTSSNGVAWIRSASGPREGAAQFVASIPGTEVKRVVQQTASEPCNIRMKASRQGDKLLLETDPIRDCSGNPVPDGTIVTFSQVSPAGRSTVDARIKKGVARAVFPASERASLSVASGVVLGNEINLGGGAR